MTFRRVAQIVGLGCVYTLGLLTLVGTGTNNPVTPTNAALQIPGTTPGMWQDVLPQGRHLHRTAVRHLGAHCEGELFGSHTIISACDGTGHGRQRSRLRNPGG
jgi:hypothetical protein